MTSFPIADSTRTYRSTRYVLMRPTSNNSSVLPPRIEVAQCEREDIRAYLKCLNNEHNLKEASIKRHIASVRPMFYWLETEEIINVTPFH